MKLFDCYIGLSVATLVLVCGCSSPQPGPDKTLAGAVLGAGWGAGAGAVVGNQIEGTPTGEGAAIGAGLGLVGGAISGLGYDQTEDTQIEHAKQLRSLEIQNTANGQQIARMQASLDRAIISNSAGGVHSVYFDVDATNIRAGAVANLEAIAESIKTSPAAYRIYVVGHSDDTGDPKYNERLAEARARTVSGYLAARGISSDQITVRSFGAKRPIASNANPVGRQLNRRAEIYIGRQ